MAASELILQERQMDHYEREIQMIRKNLVIMDSSNPGAGKSYTTMKLAQRFNLDMCVICPKSMIPTWQERTREYGITLHICMSYASWRSSGNIYLTYENNVYYPTANLITLIQSGVLFVFDESHNLKNNTTITQQSCHVVIKNLITYHKYYSRAILLTATPFDKEENICSLLQMLGIITEDGLMKNNDSNSHSIPTGIRQLIRKCTKWSPKITQRIVPDVITKDNVNSIALELYKLIVKKLIVSFMPAPEIAKDAKNAFYEVDKIDLKTLKRGEAALKKALSFRKSDGSISEVSSRTAITNAVRLLGKGKLRTILRKAIQDLEENPQAKIIIFVWFVDHIIYLKEQLQEYNPLLLYGEVRKNDERKRICDLFQATTADHRILIANTTVGGVGLSLDDQDGNWPRITYIVPDYRIIDSCQGVGRTARANTKSIPKIRFVYAKDFEGERSIMESLARKTTTLRDALASDQIAEFPGDYDVEIEENADLSILARFPPLLEDEVINIGMDRNDQPDITTMNPTRKNRRARPTVRRGSQASGQQTVKAGPSSSSSSNSLSVLSGLSGLSSNSGNRSMRTTRTTRSTRTTVSQPVVSQPVVSQPVVSQPVVNQPVVNQPVVNQPVVSQINNTRILPTKRIKLKLVPNN